MLSSSSILKINFQIRLHFRLIYVRNFSSSQNLTLAKPLLFIMFEVWLYSRLLLMYYVSVFYDDGMIITSSLLSFPYVMVKVSLKAIWKSPSSFICASESAVVYKRDEERRLCCFSRLYSKCIRLWMKHEKATYLRWWVYDLCEKGRSILWKQRSIMITWSAFDLCMYKYCHTNELLGGGVTNSQIGLKKNSQSHDYISSIKGTGRENKLWGGVQ